MARVAVELTNFTGGELSPRLDGRTDLTKYTSGCATLENLIVYPHGSAARRPGSTFVAEVADSDNKTLADKIGAIANLDSATFVRQLLAHAENTG